MKKTTAAAVLLAALLFILPISGCDNTVETVEGKWRSGDGCVLSLTEGTLTLSESDGSDALGTALPYYIKSGELYVTVGTTTVCAFKAYLDEDTLTLKYSTELIELMNVGNQHAIVLERVEK